MSEERFVLKGYLAMHKAIQKHIARYETAARRLIDLTDANLDKLMKGFEFYWNIVEGHHLGEDNQLFPAIAERDANFALDLRLLSEDHQIIDHIVAEIGTALSRTIYIEDAEEREVAFCQFLILVHSFRIHLAEHLAREEALVIPSVSQHFSVAEQHGIEAAVFADMSENYLAMMVPWVLHALDVAEASEMYANLPEILQERYNTVWKKRYNEIIATFVLPDTSGITRPQLELLAA